MRKEEEIKQIMDLYNKHKEEERKQKKETARMLGKVTAVGVVGGAAVLGILYGAEKLEDKIPVTENNAYVQYDSDKFRLDELYVLTSNEEKHICYLDQRGHIEAGVGFAFDGQFGLGFVPRSDPSVYVDIKTNQQISIEGYEKTFGYKVEPLVDYVNLEDFDQASKILTMSEEQYEIITEVEKTKVKVKTR